MLKACKNLTILISGAVLCLSVGCTALSSNNQTEAKVATAQNPNSIIKAEPIAIKAMSLGPGDIFEVRVYNEKDLSNVYRVSDEGTISFPLVGNIYVNKVSSAKLVERLESELKTYLKNPQVSVFVKEFHSKKVYVFGQVRKPGTFSYEEGMNIIQAITLAGGLQPLADPNATYVNRIIDGAEKRIKVAVKDIGRGEASNLILRPGDIVYVPESIF